MRVVPLMTFVSYHQTTSEGATPPTSRSAVTNGEYASSSEVVREALRDWQLRRSLHQKELEELQRLWQEGANSGPGNLASIQAIKAEARRRFKQAE